MPNYYYFDSHGQRQGLINDAQLQVLATRGIIKPTTLLQTESGQQDEAGNIPGLKFKITEQTSTAPPTNNIFCTNCGNIVSEQAVACLSCGARPTGHRKFCRHCGMAINAEQIICIKCGAAIGTVKNVRNTSHSTSSSSSWEKNKLVAGLLGILLGGIGAHKYYMGSWGWGLVFTAIMVFTLGLLGFITAIIGLVEGIIFLVMSEETFAEKYPPDTEHPFRW